MTALHNWVPVNTDKTPIHRNPGPFDDLQEGVLAGFLLDDRDDIVCIDFDHCAGDDWALEELAKFPNTFKERSISGDGYHVWLKGRIPKEFLSDGRSGRFGRKNPGHWLEVYGGKKIIIVTGIAVDGKRNLEYYPSELSEICEKYFMRGNQPKESQEWKNTDFPFKNTTSSGIRARNTRHVGFKGP